MESQISQSQKGKLLIVLSIVLVFSSMNATMFNIALPTISKEFELSASQASWVVTSFMIVYAVGSVIYGRLADQYKLKTLLTIGLSFFAFGSLIGFFALNYWFVVVARILQAIGASILPASAMIIPARYFTPETRGRALGMTSAGLAFGIAVGPIIAGLITTSLTWHYLFITSIIPGLSIPFFRKYLDDTQGAKSPVDYIGALLLGLTISAWLLAITNSNLTYFLVGCVCLILFIWRITKAKNPFIQPSLFKNTKYTRFLLIWGLGGGIGFGLPYLMPQLFTEVHHLSPMLSGVLMFPGAALAAILSRSGGKIADTKGNAVLTYFAISCLFVSFLMLTFMVGVSVYFVILPLIFGYVGQTFYQLAMANTISRTLSKDQAGTGMGLFMLVNFVSSSISASIMGKTLEQEQMKSIFSFMHLDAAVAKYSNIYVTLTLIVVVIALLYTFFTRGINKSVLTRAEIREYRD